MNRMPWAPVLALLVATTAGAASVNPLGGGLSGGYGSAFNPATQQLFFAEQYSGEVSRFDLSNNTVTTVHTGLVGPSGLAMFSNYVYITTRDGRLFKGAPGSNTRSEVTNGLGMPQQLVIDANNATAYVIESANGDLWKVNLWGGQKTATPTGLSGAIGLAMSADFQTAYITDAVRLVKLDLGTGALTEVINGLDHAFFLEWADDARTALYVTERTSPGRVRRIDLSTTPATITLVANVPSLSASV
jgi:DNA-binding beta-propeller fold protein YncE